MEASVEIEDRPEIRLSLSIMHLPSDPHRRAFVKEMVQRMGGHAAMDRDLEYWEITPDPTRSGPWPTARRSWLSSARAPRATHHVLLQDDALVCRDFIASLKAAIQQVPDEAMTLAVNHRSVDEARRIGSHWVAFRSDIWGNIVLPSGWVMPCIRWIDANIPAEYFHDERRISIWLMTQGKRTYCPVPNLLDQAPIPSTLGHAKGRFARWFIGADTSGLTVDWSKGASDPVVAPSGFTLAARWKDVQNHYEKAARKREADAARDASRSS